MAEYPRLTALADFWKLNSVPVKPSPILDFLAFQSYPCNAQKERRCNEKGQGNSTCGVWMFPVEAGEAECTKAQCETILEHMYGTVEWIFTGTHARYLITLSTIQEGCFEIEGWKISTIELRDGQGTTRRKWQCEKAPHQRAETRRIRERVSRTPSRLPGNLEADVLRRTRIILILAAIVLVLAVRTVFVFARYSRVERVFASIQVGESRAAVIKQIGKPNYHGGKCGVIHVPDKNCSLEYVYSHPFAPIVPDYYIVSFSSDDHVIEADQWNSP
jgi:hypothetical protein